MKRPSEMTPRDREDFLSMVHEAYESKGLRPRAHSFGVGTDGSAYSAPSGCCCPLGALLVGTQPDLTDFEPGEEFIPDIWGDLRRITGWTSNELTAFVHAVDDDLSIIDDRHARELGAMTKDFLWGEP